MMETTEPTVLALSSGRLIAFTTALIGLTAVVTCAVALIRAARARRGTGAAPGRADIGIGLGLVAAVVGAVHAATTDGGLGTGNGRGGAIVAVVLGVAAAILGGLALARTRAVG